MYLDITSQNKSKRFFFKVGYLMHSNAHTAINEMETSFWHVNFYLTLGNEGDQQKEDCHHGDENASRDPRSVETRSHAKRRNSTHFTPFTDQ